MVNRVYNVDEVAQHFRVHEQTVRSWIKRGTLTGFKAGRDWRFTESDVVACEQKLRESSKAAASNSDGTSER